MTGWARLGRSPKDFLGAARSLLARVPSYLGPSRQGRQDPTEGMRHELDIILEKAWAADAAWRREQRPRCRQVRVAGPVDGRPSQVWLGTLSHRLRTRAARRMELGDGR